MATTVAFSTPHAPRPSQLDRFLFDLNGYLVVKNVFTAEEIASANKAIDSHSNDFVEREGSLRNTREGSKLSGDGVTGRRDLGGALEWNDSDVFRAMLAHPRLVPYYHMLLGEGYRMDHLPLIISQRKGAEGFSLHGGPLTASGGFNSQLTYTYSHGSMHTSLLAAALQLTDIHEGDGGFVVVKGSHKSNFPIPDALVHGDMADDILTKVCSRAGDVVLFSEATIHGTLPWKAETERRAVLYRFAPNNMAYGRTYLADANGGWPERMLHSMTTAQRAVLEPPYNNRLDRPVLRVTNEAEILSTLEGADAATLGSDAAVHSEGRAPVKKDFDKTVFGTDYF